MLLDSEVSQLVLNIRGLQGQLALARAYISLALASGNPARVLKTGITAARLSVMNERV